MTILTWCDECGADMDEVGVSVCPLCGIELCHDCMIEHKEEHITSSEDF